MANTSLLKRGIKRLEVAMFGPGRFGGGVIVGDAEQCKHVECVGVDVERGGAKNDF